MSLKSLINGPMVVVGSLPRVHLACRLRRTWRASPLPTSFESHQCLLPYSATACIQATGTACTGSGTSPYVSVTVRSLVSAALAFVRHWLWVCLTVRCACSQMPSQRVAYSLKLMLPFPTISFTVNVGQKSELWPRLRMNSAASIVAISNFSPASLGHSMLFTTPRSSVVTTSITSLTVASQSKLSTKDNPWAEPYSSTHLVTHLVYIVKWIGDTGELCETPLSTGCFSMALPSVIISNVLSETKLLVHCIRSQSS